MNKQKIILTLLTLAILTSCDCRQIVTGTIVDKATKEPIDSAYIYKENRKNDNSFSDKKGNFSVNGISGGLFGCPPMTVVISKEGYETQIVEIENTGHETIKLKRTAN